MRPVIIGLLIPFIGTALGSACVFFMALSELDRVCRPNGTLIIPTYMNKDRNGDQSAFASAVGKAGADFKRQFTTDSYRQFFADAGYTGITIEVADGRIPCAVAIIKKH